MTGCPCDLSEWLESEGGRFIRWSIKPDLQAVSLTLIAERLYRRHKTSNPMPS
jgi:hypothetical protein